MTVAILMLAACGGASRSHEGSKRDGPANEDPAVEHRIRDFELSSEVAPPDHVESVADLPREPNPTMASFVRPFRDRGDPVVIEDVKRDILDNIDTKIRMNMAPPDPALWPDALAERRVTGLQEYQRIWVASKAQTEYDLLIEALEAAMAHPTNPIAVEGWFTTQSWEGVIVAGSTAFAAVSGVDERLFPDSWPTPATTGLIQHPVQYKVEASLEDGRWKLVAISHAAFGGW